MQKRINTYKTLLAIVLMLWGFSTAEATPYQSSYATNTAYRATYTPATINNACPTYTFHTTSVYTTVVENPSFSPVAVDPYSNNSPRGHIRRGIMEDDDDDDPDENGIGVIDNPAPIGSPLLVLLALAVGYAIVRFRRKRQTAK